MRTDILVFLLNIRGYGYFQSFAINMMLAVGIYMLFIKFMKFPSVMRLLSVFFFIAKECLILLNAFSTPVEMIMQVYSFIY